MPTKTETPEQRGELDKFFACLNAAAHPDTSDEEVIIKKEVYKWMLYFLGRYGTDFMNDFVFRDTNLFEQFWNSFDYGAASTMLLNEYIQPILTHKGITSGNEFDEKFGRDPNGRVPRSLCIGLGEDFMRKKVNNVLQGIFPSEAPATPSFLPSSVPGTPYTRAPASSLFDPPPGTPNPNARSTMVGAPASSLFGPPSVASGTPNARSIYNHYGTTTPMSMKSASSIRYLSNALATDHRSHLGGENIHPNSYHAGNQDSFLSATYAGLSIDGSSMPSSIGGGSNVQTRKTSTELWTGAALDGIHHMMINVEDCKNAFSALESDQNHYLHRSSSFASAETHTGLSTLRALVKDEEDSFVDELNALDERKRRLAHTVASAPNVADLARAKAEEDQRLADRLKEEEIAKKKHSAKVEYDAKCLQYDEELASQKTDSNSAKQATLSVIGNNLNEQLAQSNADLAEVEQKRTIIKDLKVQNLTLVKAKLAGIEGGFKLFQLLRHVHTHQGGPNTDLGQKYMAMKSRHEDLLSNLEDENNLNELKRLVWGHRQNDDDISL